MVASNAEIAARLRQLAELLKHQGANRFKVRAYRSAADAIRVFPTRIAEALARGESLPRIPGVGASIGSAIQEIAASGTLSSVERLAGDLPEGTAVIAEATGLSINEAKRLVKGLGIANTEQLEAKLAAGEVARAVGERLEWKVRRALEHGRRLLWEDASNLAKNLAGFVSGVKGVAEVEVAGGIRRGEDTVGSIRLVVRSRAFEHVREAIRGHGGVEAAVEKGSDRLICTLASGPKLIVRNAARAGWGNALVEETGSDDHLAEVRNVAGISARLFGTEEDWYRAGGLPWIPPELREGRGEVRAALDGALPDIIDLKAIRGDLHAHTTESDGVNTLDEMAAAAQARGYSYLAITDHSKSLKITGGLDEKRLRAQGRAIDRLNAKRRGFRVFKGSEVDILADGTLDFEDKVLAKLDIVIASIHSRFGLDREAQTRRLLHAVENPYVTCIGHLTGRKLLSRPGYSLDLNRILGAVKSRHVWLEINSSPDRLDINDELAFRARDMGIPLLINTDAHSIRELDFMKFGVQQARRGWQSATTVLNTLPLAQFQRRLRARRRAK